MPLDLDDTIAAIASAPGGALRGIVRVSGPNCIVVVAQIAHFSQPINALSRLTCMDGTIDLPQGLGLVPVRLYLWPTVKSYTGEPCAELHLLGSPPLLAATLEAACTSGARLARNGEFTLRAFLAGRLDLTQAEAVLGVIDADSRRALDTALSQLAGGLARPLAALRERLLDLLAHLEAGLDFVEEDIEFISRTALDEELAALDQALVAVTEQVQTRGEANELPRVVLYGLPNAGKSSLLNALAGADAAIVAPTEGTTRDFVARRIMLAGRECLFSDTAGVQVERVRDELNRAAQAATTIELSRADLALLCIDHSRQLTPWDEEALAAARPNQFVVFTKCDLPPAPHDKLPAGAILTSSRTGHGVSELKRAVLNDLESRASEAGAIAGTAQRCRESLRLAGEALARARRCVPAGQGDEIVAAELRVALDELGRVVGAVYTDDVLDRVFSRFCIGK